MNAQGDLPSTKEWVEQGLLVRSLANSEKWVSPQGMTQIAKKLAEGIKIEQDHRVVRLSVAPGAQTWHVTLEERVPVLSASAVVLTQPVPQSIELWENSFPGQVANFKGTLGSIRYRPALVLIGNVPEEFRQHSFLAQAPFELVLPSEAKGLELATTAAAAFFDEKFSSKWFEISDAQLLEETQARFRKAYGFSLAAAQIKKWRFGRAVTPSTLPFLTAPVRPPLYVAGDGFAGGEAAVALRSAEAVAKEIIRTRPAVN